MTKSFTIIFGGISSVGLLVAALWMWQSALRLSVTSTRPEVALWAVRSGAVAAGAIAQTIVLTFVCGRIYGREIFGELLRVLAALIGSVALISAVALGLASR